MQWRGTGAALFVRLTSNGAVEGAGFTANFTCDPVIKCDSIDGAGTSFAAAACAFPFGALKSSLAGLLCAGDACTPAPHPHSQQRLAVVTGATAALLAFGVAGLPSFDAERLAATGGDLSASGARVCKGHRAQINDLCVAPDGAQVVTGSTDGTVRRWKPESGEELDCWERKDAPQEYQDLADAGGRWQQPRRRSRGGTFIDVAGEQVHWAGIGEWSCWAVREDGTLLLSKGSEFRVVHLYRGLGRVGIDGEALA